MPTKITATTVPHAFRHKVGHGGAAALWGKENIGDLAHCEECDKPKDDPIHSVGKLRNDLPHLPATVAQPLGASAHVWDYPYLPDSLTPRTVRVGIDGVRRAVVSQNPFLTDPMPGYIENWRRRILQIVGFINNARGADLGAYDHVLVLCGTELQKIAQELYNFSARR